jgi:major membrane immunogen (membrane-anchored lipoprotein)
MTEQKDKVTVSIELDGVKISASNEDFEHSPGEVFELFRAVLTKANKTLKS